LVYEGKNKMSERPTPETDNERTLKLALEVFTKLANTLKQERDEAREEVKELIYIAERGIALAEIDFENDKFRVVSELRDALERIKEGAK
jgi:hypothetical protein